MCSFPSKEFRRGFRKSKAELEQLPEDSRQVLVQSSYDHYARRPALLEDTCLGVFVSRYTVMSRSADALLRPG
ncbi:unnamed protein product, partial [Allacma fusca]